MSQGRYVFDIETNGFMVECDKIWCAVVIDYDTGEEFRYDEHQMDAFAAQILSANYLIGHNIVMFDIPVVERLLGITLTAKPIDTLIISRMMYPDKFKKNPVATHSLASWGDALGEPKTDYKGVLMEMAKDRTPKADWKPIVEWSKGNIFAGPPNDTVGHDEWMRLMVDYCAQDVVVNAKVLRKQQAWVDRNPKPLAMEHIATAICARMVFNGWGFDADGGERLEAELMMAKAEALDNLRKVFPTIVNERYSEKQVDKATGQPKRLKDEVIEFNPGSHMHVYQRLNERYNDGFKPPLTDLGAPQCDVIVLNEYLATMPEIADILVFRDIVKFEGQVKMWNEKADASPDHNIHGGINVQGTATGRCTHSKPNMAQVHSDPRARGLFVPLSKGEVVLGADLSGLELRMLAHYMHPFDGGAYADLILNGDIHTANQKAAGLASREQAKTFIYGFLYGGGDAKIGEIVGGSKAHGRRLKEQFLRNLPALAKLSEEVSNEAEEKSNLILPDGRTVPVRHAHAALNTLLQGAGAIVSKYWMVVADHNLTARFGKDVVRQVAYVHDEVQYSCPAELAEEAGQIVIDSALEAGRRLDIRMPVGAEYAIGKSWADTH